MSMKQVPNTLDIPFRWICSIQATYEEKIFKTADATSSGDTVFSSGILISPRHILTCAHNISGVKKVRGKFITSAPPKEIRVILGRDDRQLDKVFGIARPFGSYKARRWKIPSHYNEYRDGDSSAPYDYAIIELWKNVGSRKYTRLGKKGRRVQLGWWGKAYRSYIRPVDSSFASSLRKKKVNLSGYPYNADPGFDKPTETPAGIQMINFDSVTGVFIHLSGKKTPLMSYRAITDKGSSGAPVWAVDRKTGNRYLVAIHQAEQQFPARRLGVLITPNVIQQLKAWGLKNLDLSMMKSIS